MKNKDKIKVEVGDVFFIPLKDGTFGWARVEFISKRYKKAMQCGLYSFRTARNSASVNLLNSNIVKIFYTSTEMLEKKLWGILPGISSNIDSISTRRIVAGRVVELDEDKGPATSEDKRNLPKMNLAGKGFVEIMCSDILNDVPVE